MGRLVAMENLSLDGVMQAPGRPDEDVRGGFTQGGWATAYNDADKGRIIGAGMSDQGPMLFGRRTYEDFFQVWGGRSDNPFSQVFDNTRKYVVSTTLAEPLQWKNSTLLQGDVPRAIRHLKGHEDKSILIMGSGELVRSLVRHGLVDELVLLIHPLVLGSGRRLFADDGACSSFGLSACHTTGAGVVIATYARC